MGGFTNELRAHGITTEFWGSAGASLALPVGTVLVARDAADDDPYRFVIVVGTQRVDEVEEAILRPFVGFGEAVSAPVHGDGGVLRSFDVISAAEEDALRSSLPDGGVDVEAEDAAWRQRVLSGREADQATSR